MNKEYAYPIMSNYEQLMFYKSMFISFPRTGTHFLKWLLQDCFNTQELYSGIGEKFKKDQDYMWFHDHDAHCFLPFFNKVLYLYRNPVPVLSSFVFVEKKQELNKNYSEEEIINVLTKLYYKHLKKYLVDYPNKVVSIKYEKLISDQKYSEFLKVCNYFNIKITQERFNKIYNNLTKERVIKKVLSYDNTYHFNNYYYGNFLLSNKYAEYKIYFKEKYTKLIYDILQTDSKGKINVINE